MTLNTTIANGTIELWPADQNKSILAGGILSILALYLIIQILSKWLNEKQVRYAKLSLLTSSIGLLSYYFYSTEVWVGVFLSVAAGFSIAWYFREV
ncbi:MAG: hypothetical protein SGJ04_00175 [Bacteroidota bacterium]|nr:hypothetical protein [Bacteroidota bacterium]